MKTDLSAKISKLLKERNMTQKELAQMIGVTEASMSRYIKGDRIPKSEIIANMATALKTTVDYLLGTEIVEDNEFPKIKRLIARNSSKMSIEEKRELVNALFDDSKE